MSTIGPPSSYPAFGEVWWLNRPTGQRYFLFMSPPEVVKDASNAHLHFCRLTTHSRTPFAQGGEWPLLFTNDRMPNLFPNSFKFKLGVGQASCIDFMPKSAFSAPKPSLWERLGLAHPRLLSDFRSLVKTIFTAPQTSFRPTNRLRTFVLTRFDRELSSMSGTTLLPPNRQRAYRLRSCLRS